MAKTRAKQVTFHTISEWRAANVTPETREFLGRCDAERQDDIPTTMKARVEELLASGKLAIKAPMPKSHRR